MIVTRPANACFRRDTAARRERFAPCVPHPARLARSMSRAIALCTRAAARRTAHASRAPHPAYPAPCQRSRESAANAKLPCLPFCDTEQRRPGSTHSPTSASSLSAIHQPELQLPPIIAISREVHQFAAFPSASSCASIAKSLSPKRREDLLSIPYVHAHPVQEKAPFLATEPRSGTD